MFGERPTAGRVLMALAAGGLPAMVLYQFVLRAVLIVDRLPAHPLIPSRLAFLNEVILLERGRLAEARAADVDLCAPSRGRLLRAVAGAGLLRGAVRRLLLVRDGAMISR